MAKGDDDALSKQSLAPSFAHSYTLWHICTPAPQTPPPAIGTRQRKPMHSWVKAYMKVKERAEACSDAVTLPAKDCCPLLLLSPAPPPGLTADSQVLARRVLVHQLAEFVALHRCHCPAEAGAVSWGEIRIWTVKAAEFGYVRVGRHLISSLRWRSLKRGLYRIARTDHQQDIPTTVCDIPPVTRHLRYGRVLQLLRQRHEMPSGYTLSHEKMKSPGR